MEPIAVTVRGERRWMLIHRCTRCGRLRMNRAAGDDNVLVLMQLAALPPRHAARPIPQPGHAAWSRLQERRSTRLTQGTMCYVMGRSAGLIT
jgi:hypothetical protein